MRILFAILVWTMLLPDARVLASKPSVGLAQDMIEFTLHEPLHRDWAPAWVSFPLEVPKGRLQVGTSDAVTVEGQLHPKHVERLLVAHEQHGDGTIKRATAHAYTGLQAGEHKILRFTANDVLKGVTLIDRQVDGDKVCLGTDRLAVQTPWRSHVFDPPVSCQEVPAPIIAVGRADGKSRNMLATGQLVGVGKIRQLRVRTDQSIPHICQHELRYQLADGGEYVVRLTLISHEPAVLVEEDFSKLSCGGFRLDLSSGLKPTMGHGRGRLHPPTDGEPTEGYRIDFAKAWTGRIQPFYAWWHDYGLWWAAYKPGGDYVGILPMTPPKWRNPPPNPIQIHTGPGGKVEAIFPFRKGARHWAIVVASADEALRRSPGGADLMRQTVIRLAQNPLDKVKDLALTWPGMDAIENPRLLCTAKDVPRIREKAHTHPLFKRVLEKYPTEPGDPAGLYLATGDEKYARQAIDDLIKRLRAWIEDALDGGNYGEALNAIGFSRPLRSYALVYDLVAGSKSITHKERDYCLRAFAFLAYCLYDESRWPARYQGFARGNVNFHSDDYTCRATVVCLLKGHPRQQEWMDYVTRELEFEFASSVYPGGAWCEAPNYQGYTMHYLMIGMRAMQLNGFADFAKDPRFRATMDYFSRIQTPYDVRAKMHMLPTVGDTSSYYHSQSLQNTFAWAAMLFRDDPRLAGRMMYAWHRAGSVLFGAHAFGPGNGWTQPLTLVDPEIPEVPPAQPLQSERLPGYGALLRNNYGTDRESYFLFKMGQADQHYDSDEGGFHWYALGKPLSLDFGSMYTPSIEQPWLHSTLDFNRHRTWTRGEVTQFVSLPDVDFCTGELAVNDIQAVADLPQQSLPEGVSSEIERGKRFIDWRRQVLFVKGADYVVMRDDLDDVEDLFATGWTMQVLASDAQINGQRARLIGQHGVDLDVLVAQPAGAVLTTSRWGYKPHKTPQWVAVDPMPPVSETQIALRTTAPVDADYLVTMFPYDHGTEPPVIASPGKGVIQIDHQEGSDLVFFGGSRGLMRADNVTFAGRVGMVRRTKDATTLHILEGISMRLPEMIAQFPGPVSMEIRREGLRGATDGPARTCFLHWVDPPPIPARLTIDGKDAYVYSTFDGYVSFTVPEGRHTFEVKYDLSRP